MALLKKTARALLAALLSPALCFAHVTHDNDSVVSKTRQLGEGTVTSKNNTKRLIGAVNGVQIGQQEIFRAACCSLGESFTTNPSVDVNYSDAATGAQQIKLLGLSGTYVQMLTETMPAFRGSASPYSLSFVPGTWMKSISVSKGAASVKNGYESITGQIDIEYLKPDDEEHANIDLFINQMLKCQADMGWNKHLNDNLSTVLLLHYNKDTRVSDVNGDHFHDIPQTEQVNIANRWKLKLPRYIMHAGASLLSEKRMGGTTDEAVIPYHINISTDRYEAYMKHAFILNPEKGSNIAFFMNGAMNKMDSRFGEYQGELWQRYKVDEKNLSSQLMYETKFDDHHSLSTGLSFYHDRLKQYAIDRQVHHSSTWWIQYDNVEEENTYGAYAEYTYTLGMKLTAMAGLRWDRSSIHGAFMTPRAHIKYQPWDVVSFRLSAGKGYRTVHALAENSNLFSSGRSMLVQQDLKQEEAWNYGISAAFNIPIGEKTLKVNAEYYYTDFIYQAVVDYIDFVTPNADASITDMIYIHDLIGKSYSHVYQIDASYNLFRGLDITMAYRRNNVKCTYGAHPYLSNQTLTFLSDKPLTSKYKGLVTASWKDELELWQLDATLQINGGGILPDMKTRYSAYPLLSAQVTRSFRYFDAYIGSENITDFIQKDAIRHAENPYSADFEPTFIYGPVDGRMIYAGVRIKL